MYPNTKEFKITSFISYTIMGDMTQRTEGICSIADYYMAELVHGEKEHSDWFLVGSVFCYTDR